MSKFPVEMSDDEGQVDAINYLLSGPSGLGQNFSGYSDYTFRYLTGNFRPPFSDVNNANLTVDPISLGTSTMLDEYTWKFFFASTQPTAPFALGNPVTVSGVTDSYYDGDYSPIGVVECTTTYFIVKTNGAYPVVPDSTGGTVEYNNTIFLPPYPDPDSGWISTDCNAKVKVTGGTDRVFLNAQLNCELVYDSTVSSDLSYQVAINRYKGFITSDPTNPDFRFIFDKTIAFKETLYSGVTPTLSGVIPDLETLFISFIDEPEPSYYWYILEVRFIVGTGDLTIVQDTLKLRSFSAQVVKQ